MVWRWCPHMIYVSTQLDRLSTAREHAQELSRTIEHQSVPARWASHCNLATVFARLGDVPSATRHFERAKELAVGYDTSHRFETVGFHLLEAEGRHHEVIASVQSHLKRHLEQLAIGERIVLASLLQRSCKALGNEYEARRWRQFEEDCSKSVLLSDILICRITLEPQCSEAEGFTHRKRTHVLEVVSARSNQCRHRPQTRPESPNSQLPLRQHSSQAQRNESTGSHCQSGQL